MWHVRYVPSKLSHRSGIPIFTLYCDNTQSATALDFAGSRTHRNSNVHLCCSLRPSAVTTRTWREIHESYHENGYFTPIPITLPDSNVHQGNSIRDIKRGSGQIEAVQQTPFLRIVFRLFVRSMIGPDVCLQQCSCYSESIVSAAKLQLLPDHSESILQLCQYNIDGLLCTCHG